VSGLSEETDRHVLRLGNYQLKLGSRTGFAAMLAVLLIVMGFVVSPHNPGAGIITGVSGVIGSVLGVLLDIKPVPVSHRAEAVGAVRKLNEVVRAVEDVQTTLQQLTGVPMSVRVSVGMANAQDDLERVRSDLYESMGEWEQISPGAGQAVQDVRSAGSNMLNKMTAKQEETS
jgi:hypothetical protein